MSFHEVAIAIRAENRTMGAFRAVAMDVVHLGYAFGALDSQTGRMLTGIMTAVHLFTSLKAILATTTTVQHAHNAAVGVQTTLQGYAITTTSGLSLSYIAHAVAAKIAAVAQWALNMSFATFLALTGVGIGVIIAAVAAMQYFASATRDAASAQAEYNEQVARSPRSIRRAGEEESLRGRGIEW